MLHPFMENVQSAYCLPDMQCANVVDLISFLLLIIIIMTLCCWNIPFTPFRYENVEQNENLYYYHLHFTHPMQIFIWKPFSICLLHIV